ncbi:ribosome recycling factor [Mangrovibacterium marinum]|uniref:Ribosome-recycling factor n=1 Tax=Mangrovibacterium marinum TaxID=1639118 RepID=A0A2T5C6H3_9BACT|nr:ribosome recycling factor [Mangrovibacterium marinum]PTN10502.1 ribosome recycling factor [Mangrovibacterium marinum]
MEEEVELILDLCKERMAAAIEHLEKELVHIRAGKASPRMLDGVTVDYYGSMTPLAQVSNINTPDARTIAVQPWEKQLIPEIEKAIINANLGFNPENNGELIRINVPPLTEERRKSLSKQANTEGENAKVAIRSARKEANDALKKLLKTGLSEDLEKDAETTVQNMTNDFAKSVESLLEKKTQEIFTI